MRNGECGSLKHGMHVSMGSEPHEPVEERFIGNMSVGLRIHSRRSEYRSGSNGLQSDGLLCFIQMFLEVLHEGCAACSYGGGIT